ncbi:PAS domain S-box protein [Methanoregula formicica]|uniref:PAS/PAC domain protein n=1 Tax=Methanoregula formicica (strain DSM 22288 / NBRC 105244 / SMSP) TaxID=593750 RepID=L0H991_METFS|nr:PAS domain S-box protein [Methanoregula formicica]AGB01302.1 PAS/PAC domain protein [Methanoregula formicica SMSP]
MALRREITARLTNLLRKNPQGLSITEIVKKIDINRNTAGRYLDNLLISGQVEMRHFGMAKIYRLSERLPVSSVLSLSSEFVMQVDAGLRIVYLNGPFVRLIGSEEKEVTGKNIEFTKIPSFFDNNYPRLLASIQEGTSGTPSRGELDLPSCERSFSYRIVPIVFTNGQKGASLIFEDITDRKHGEALLRESEEKFRALFNNASDMITLHGLTETREHGTYIEVNDATCRKLKYTRKELLMMTPRDLVAPDSPTGIGTNARILMEESHITAETILLTKDGQRIPVELNIHLFEFKGRTVALAIIRDVTLRRKVEAQLRLMKTSIDSAYDEVFWMDMAGNFLYVNEAACRETGYSREELMAMTVFDLDPDFSPGRWEESVADLRKNKKQFFQTRHRRKDGVIIQVEIGSVYVTREKEEISVCFVRNITERNRIEAALKESEARYRSLAEASQDMIFVVDRDDRVLYVNRRAAAFHHITPDEMIGKPRSEFFPSDVSAGQLRGLRQVFSSGEPVRSESPMATPDGEILWFDHALMPISDATDNITSVLGVSRDITKRVVAEQEQRMNEEKNRFIAEHSVDIIHRLDPHCVLLYTSPSVKTLLGYEPGEVLGKSVLPMIHPDDLPGVMQDLHGIYETGQQTIISTFRFRHKDGQYILFESTTRIIRDHDGTVKEFLNISRDISGREK